MKRGYAVLLLIFALGIFGFANTALAELGSAYIKIGEEKVPLNPQPVYDQNGNITAYSFNLERTDGTVSGEIKLDPPIKGGTKGLFQQDGQEECTGSILLIFSITNPKDVPQNMGFSTSFPLNIPGDRVLIASSILDGNITDATGDSVSVSPYNQSHISEWYVESPQTDLGVGLGPAVSHGLAFPNTTYPYGPYSKSALGPLGPWNGVGFSVSITLSGGNDSIVANDNLTLDWCRSGPPVPTFSQYGYLIFIILLIVSAVFFIRRMGRAT